MRLADRLRAALLRWDRLLLALVLALPLAVSMVLGFLWLHERGWLGWFALATVGFYAAVRLVVALARRPRPGPEMRELTGPEADPDWSAPESAAFERARSRIRARLQAPIPWSDLPAEALLTVESIAADLSAGQRSALDFTLPEALLLIDRVALRYRGFLLENIPWSDRVSVRTLHWLWRKQDTATAVWETGFLAWRGVRLVLNPAVALLREAERLLASDLQNRLSEGFRRDAQAILLEEAAQAAVDLYSGRLALSAGELARAAGVGAVPLAPPEAPLQVLFLGQASAGKSTLINALIGVDRVESDAAPTTDRLSAHALSADVQLVDSPGLDGSASRRKAVLDAMAGADLILWVHRANRPGRAVDAELAREFAAMTAADPARRAPPVIHVVTAADTLPRGAAAGGSQTGAANLTPVTETVSVQMVGAPGPIITVSAVPPHWHLDVLRSAIDAALPEARRSQRNRLRLAAARGAGLSGNVRRASKGVGVALRGIWQRATDR